VGEGYVGAFEEAFVGIGVSVRSADWVVVQGADAVVGGLAFAGVKQGDSSALEEAKIRVRISILPTHRVVTKRTDASVIGLIASACMIQRDSRTI